ncbi:murein biosynthesis integral membrane protein MurJ [Pseudothermotoga thermarum]|uniref:Probable lipid II flippase MurJ n=1 Tax=Pseudothermotoga thermarum DSM 5069 TaxID=688269 RepID=F7YYD6_9THEM|nr:murein biosynthesis integral membrane protein MurJ [Pseudothermotoga thermarum]AEH50959.1 integral membrane protein MviN [Pseudothermotoga thermarum DSM 5069]
MTEIVKYGALFALATLISRFTGLVRDVLLANKFGAGSEFDAYVIAISFPFLLRRAFAEGAMTSAFVPLYNEKKDKNKFASAVITCLGLTTLTIVLVVEIYPKLVPLILATKAKPEVFTLATFLARISVPFIFFIFLWAVLYSIQNSHNVFFIPALSPVMMNIGIICGTIFSKLFDPPILGPTLGFTVGGALMFLTLVPGTLRLGFKYKPTFQGFSEFLKLFFPALIAMTVSEFNVMIDVNVASFLGPGNVSILQYANRFYQLPFGVFGVAMSTVVLPLMSYDKERYDEHLKNSLQLSLFLTLPSMVGLVVLSKRLMILVYQHGAFTHEDAVKTGFVLLFYSLGLPIYSIVAVLSRACHSKKNMRTPFVATVLSFLVNAIMDFVLGLTIGINGIAVATTLAGFCSMIYLWLKVKPKVDLVHVIKISLASIIMGIFVLTLSFLNASRLYTIVLVFCGMLAYMVLSKVFKLREFEEFFKLLRR